jgi:hypothetical protein
MALTMVDGSLAFLGATGRNSQRPSSGECRYQRQRLQDHFSEGKKWGVVARGQLERLKERDFLL